MEMVAASKMRRAQQHVVATRPYADRIRTMIGDLAGAGIEDESQFPLMEQRPIRRSEIILITSDKGLGRGAQYERHSRHDALHERTTGRHRQH